MKKLCLILITVILSSFMNVYAADVPAKFEGKDTLNVVYFGGSITFGSGATSGNSWRDKVGQWFKSEYPGTTVNNFNAGIGGTGTELGYYRAYKDVVSKNPDIVFVEFAVNDSYKTEQEAQFLLESIIRGFQKSPSNPYIILVYTSEMVNGIFKDVSAYQSTLAEYYDIPEIDLQPVIEEYLAVPGNKAQGGFFSPNDTVHPSDIGYALYAEKIIGCLETGDYFRKPLSKKNSYVKYAYGVEALECPLPKYDMAYNNGEVVKLSEGHWVKKNHWQHGDYMFTSTPGATLEYKFSGPVLGMLSMVSSGGGKIKVEIDGVEVAIKDTYYALSSNPITASESTVLGYDNKELSDSEHTLKLTVLDEINPSNPIGSHDVSIYGFFTSAMVRGLDVTVNNNTRVIKVTNRTSVVDGQPYTIGIWYGSSAENVDFDGESAICIDQAKIKNGKIDYTFTMPVDAMSGEYYVQTYNLNDDELLWTTFLFTNEVRKAQTIELINAHDFSGFNNSVAEFLEDRLKDIDTAKGVEFDSFTDAQKAYVVAELDGYTTYNDGTANDFESKLSNAFDKIEVLSRLKNENKFEEAQKELLADTAKFGISSDVMARYNALSEGSQNYALLNFRETVRNAAIPSDISTLFEAAVTVAENSAGPEGSGTPSDSPQGPSKDKDSFGGVVGGMVAGNVTLDPSVDSGEAFTDLGSVEWARTAITTLAQKGVINGKGNKKFAPLDKVTREEFLKMILVAFDIETDPADLKFEDVDKDAWYYTYVAQAVAYGIINGISDTEFGTGKNITRQDAAVILSRAVEKDKYVEIYTVDSNFKFNDIDKVSDYATSAVEALGKAKIFSGKENNMFDPFGQATRAEAAMILYNLLYK
ncbi:MAG: S-layer homology domain-containing protein [Clostridia bacterium]|nr:S-layer homology domain-containing protein [Clostridia bacterium]